MILIYVFNIFFFRKIIKSLFKNYDYHSLFRSFCCFIISLLSIGISLINWNLLLLNPLEKTDYSVICNKIMLAYIIVDTSYLIFTDNKRKELILHHIICFIVYFILWDKFILSFLAINEILSSFNFMSILNPKYDFFNKIFKLYSIIFIRLFVWLYTLLFLSKYPIYFIITIILVSIFVCLDCYWASIIISNFFSIKKNNFKTFCI